MQDPRESGLPKWAQALIEHLRNAANHQTEYLTREATELRRAAELHKSRYEAIVELLDCAAKGGHHDAKVIINIIGCHSLELQPTDEV